MKDFDTELRDILKSAREEFGELFADDDGMVSPKNVVFLWKWIETQIKKAYKKGVKDGKR